MPSAYSKSTLGLPPFSTLGLPPSPTLGPTLSLRSLSICHSLGLPQGPALARPPHPGGPYARPTPKPHHRPYPKPIPILPEALWGPLILPLAYLQGPSSNSQPASQPASNQPTSHQPNRAQIEEANEKAVNVLVFDQFGTHFAAPAAGWDLSFF